MSSEMVEEQQKNVLRIAVGECYEVVIFEVSMHSWLENFVESIIANETNIAAAQVYTDESVKAYSEDCMEEAVAQSIKDLTA